jgi:hypothetical protein
MLTKMSFRLNVCALLLALAAAPSFAGTLRVTSPGTNDFLGKTNKIDFTYTGANLTLRLVAEVFRGASTSPLFRTEGRFTPDSDGKVTDSLDLNFGENTPEGTYRLRVTPFEGATQFAAVAVNNLTIDVVEPKFRQINPLNGAFVRGLQTGPNRGKVPIRVDLDEPNVDNWKVQVNGANIPDNTGSSRLIQVFWDVAGVRNDGEQRISVEVEDKAKNKSNRNLSITLDRRRPSSNISSPNPNRPIEPGASIIVVVDISDQFQGAVVSSGVVVTYHDLNGRFLGTVVRRGTNPSGNNLQWTGRIRSSRALPPQFLIRVNATDKAGNAAIRQEVRVRVAGR